jgi:hypothetical protein
VTIQAKYNILVCNLLQNSAEAGDILLDIPAVLSKSLPLPEITIAQVE